jgi:hypothetical protein
LLALFILPLAHEYSRDRHTKERAAKIAATGGTSHGSAAHSPASAAYNAYQQVI